MSVVVRGMKMPESCAKCNFRGGSGVFCTALEAWIDDDNGNAPKDMRHRKCPLQNVPTPHGRLIDADALIADANERYKQQKTEHEKNVIVGLENALGGLFLDTAHTVVVNALSEEYAPTVLEAEDEDDG